MTEARQRYRRPVRRVVRVLGWTLAVAAFVVGYPLLCAWVFTR
jgi:hypothetical protein